MKVFVNGFWHGFVQRTDGVHFGVFEHIFNAVFNTSVTLTGDLYSADILLESHFSPSLFSRKAWKYSVFFSCEGSIPLPSNVGEYTLVLGAQTTTTNHVRCPLFLMYDFCTPAHYPTPAIIPPKGICSVISSSVDSESRYRFKFLKLLEDEGIVVDHGGRFRNNIGYSVPGQYYEAPMIDFYSQYRIVLALENTVEDAYITEKVVNPMRAGTIPAYYGSDRVDEYVNRDRIVIIDPTNPEATLSEIKRLLTDDAYWLKKMSTPAFVKPLANVLMDIIEECKIVLNPAPFVSFIIGNEEKEPERAERLAPHLSHYNIRPQAETYGDPSVHPFFHKFSTHLNNPMISLTINHIALLKKAVNKNKFVLMFESDVMPLMEYPTIDSLIGLIIASMNSNNIDFVFLGKGCFYDGINTADKPFLEPCLYKVTTSRCTESYLVSPKGIVNYLQWFYATNKHDIIDWDMNYYYRDNPSVKVCWAIPELFEQGTQKGIYKSRLRF